MHKWEKSETLVIENLPDKNIASRIISDHFKTVKKTRMKKLHFIGIGSSVMQNMAIALLKNGYAISGSDENIPELSRVRLEQHGILPKDKKWHPEKINKNVDAVILSQYAFADNPELVKAQELGIKVYSYAEFLYEICKDKIRIVIGGSNGKTTITSLIIHALTFNNVDVDFLIGAELEGYDTMVQLSSDANIIVIEGDENIASAIDPNPKFHLYKANIGLISGIAWDHANVFPSFYIYIDQFRKFINSIEPGGNIVYCENDIMVKRLVDEQGTDIQKIPYRTHPYETFENRNFLIVDSGRIPLAMFGEHNMQNISGALEICRMLGLTDQMFYNAMLTFKGTSKRLQLLGKNDSVNVYLDFAHSPSTLSATIKAVRQQFPTRHLVACMELYSSSSLNDSFIEQYNGTMDLADTRFVYYNPNTAKIKGKNAITAEQVFNAFGNAQLKVFTDHDELLRELQNIEWQNKNLLFMSSGNFSGVDFSEIVEEITGD